MRFPIEVMNPVDHIYSCRGGFRTEKRLVRIAVIENDGELMDWHDRLPYHTEYAGKGKDIRYQTKENVFHGAVTFVSDGLVVHPAVIRDYLMSCIGERDRASASRPMFLRGWKKECRHPYVYRGGPVPFSGSRGRYCYYRHMRSTQEIRFNDGMRDLNDEVLEDYGVAVRYRHRNRGKLPQSWDDYVRQDIRDRNWKRHRLNQWK